MKQKLLSLGLSLALVLGLAAGCAPKAGPEESPAPETTPPAAEGTAPVPETPTAAGVEIRLGLLNGPTGMGAAKLLADSDAGETVNHYEYAIGSDPSTDIVPKLNNGELDIAAVPTNLAATLYNKAGSIRLLALNTLGVLHILENGDTVHSMADLAGKTIYSINQGTNTEYVLNYLLEESGLTPGEDVTIEWKTSEEVTALMASGGIDLCMLPVPAATSVMMQNADVRDAIDLNDVWQKMGAAGTFTMGCVVARSDFVEEHPEAVDAFLTEYTASIAYVNEHPEEAAALVEQYGIVPKAAVAKAAIPQANMVCLTGDELKGISDYYEVLYAADPTSIGGAIPDDNFYYIP
uniref:ABC transporter substrate-binding protein n=1 Tax=Flavonifractor plautii TaxID=292800 RepID=UPI003FF0DE34